MSIPVELTVTGGRLLTATGTIERGWIAVVDGRIDALGPGDAPSDRTGSDTVVVDAAGATVAPGFIDVHVHGAVGHEAMDADPDGLRAMARFFAEHGVTSFLPTTWTASRDETRAALEAIAEARGTVPGGATILGAHMEGPYLSVDKCGAQDPAHIRPADATELQAFLDTGAVRLMTLAPEQAPNLTAVEMLTAHGVTASIGHTSATYADVLAAVGAGASHATHLFNAMTPLHHREPGAVGGVLALPELRAEVIPDNLHVHPAAMRVAWHAKGPNGLVVVTDALRPTGLAPGSYAIGDRTIRHERGAMWLEDGVTLAGSAITFDAAVRNLLTATGARIDDLWPACSRNAARSAGVDARKGSIEIGMDADLVVLDPDLHVSTTIVQGTVVYRRGREAPASADELRAAEGGRLPSS